MASEGAGPSSEPETEKATGGEPETGSATGGAAAPAGWYQDPHAPGRQRYWDGAAWTGHVHPPEAPAGGGSPPYGGRTVPPYTGGTPPYSIGWDPGWAAAKAESDARQWATFAHLSALLALFVALPWLGPLVIYLVKKDAHPFIENQAREALNFNISVFIYEVVTFVAIFILAFVLIGFLLIPVAIGIGIAWLVLVIVAAVRANSGQPYRYPLTIRMVT